MGDSSRNTFARMANALSGSEGSKLEVGKLRDVERLPHLEDEQEIAQNELTGLENRKIVADLGGGGKLLNYKRKRKEIFEFSN